MKFFRKNETVKDVNKFCKAANKSNIDILGYFIIGSPVETNEYRKKLSSKIRELGIKHLFANVLFPEPNTEYYYQLLRDRILKEDHWKMYMENPTPNFKLPYPYGEKKRQEIWNYVEGLIEEFK